jgi:hypothetical protein
VRVFRFLLWLTAFCAPAALAAEWRVVPGAPDLEVDLASAQQNRAVVTAWVRYVGRARFAAGLQAGLAQKPPVAYRTAMLLQFDCEKRSLRALALNAYDSGGVPVFMSSVPGPVLPLPGDADVVWAHDALCEWGRGRG